MMNENVYSEHMIETCEEIGFLTLNKTYNELMKKITQREGDLKAILNDKQIKKLNQLLDDQSELNYFMSNFYYKFGIEIMKNVDFIKRYGLENEGGKM